MLIICNILVMVTLGTNSITQNEQLEGRILRETDKSFLADFQQDAQKHEYDGDYRKKWVSRTECTVKEWKNLLLV